MHARERPDWDREADLRAIQDAYDRYAVAGRSRLWDSAVPGYARLASELRSRLVEILEASAPHRRESRVVDLGCGEGDLAVEADAVAARTDWIGVDLRPEPIDEARRRFPQHSFLVASADSVPLDGASADVVVAGLLFSSLSSTELERAVAREVARLLKPGGWLVWLDIRYANPVNDAVHGMPERRIATLFPGWRRDLQSAGLLPPIARRLGPATRVAYPALSALPILRSHLVGRLERPTRTA